MAEINLTFYPVFSNDSLDVSEASAGTVSTYEVVFAKAFKGDAGVAGPQGPAGSQGPTGPQGATGPAGPSGAAIVSTVLEGQDAQGGNIYKQTFDNGTVARFTAPKGPTGSQGATGPQGSTGPQGPQGPKGDTGSQGPAGATGPQGQKGDTGETGAQGPAGQNGTNGTDGVSPTVSTSKSGKTTTITIVDAQGSHTVTVVGI